MPFLIYFLLFLFGLTIGSFLNCIVYRLETGKSFLRGRSFCPYCKHILTWQDLIPIFSFLILKGKCRYCSQKISIQYPLVEFSTGLLFSFIWQAAAFEISEFLFLALLSCFLIIIFVYDLKHYLIPDKVIYPAIAISFFYQILTSNFKHLTSNILFGFLPSLFFLAIILISKEKWMGFGDFKLAILMGLILGWPKILIALFFAFFIGATIGLILIFLKKKTLKSEIPFAPFLVTGTFLAIFFGQEIIDLYLNLFLLK